MFERFIAQTTIPRFLILQPDRSLICYRGVFLSGHQWKT